MKTVLLVDDQEEALELYESILNGAYSSIKASDGIKACELFTIFYSQISAIIIDYTMPKKNGDEVIEYIRIYERHHHIPRIPIMLITGEKRETLPICDYDRFIEKPFSIHIFMKTLEQLLNEKAK